METVQHALNSTAAALEEARASLIELQVPEAARATGAEVAELVAALTEDTELAVAAWITHVRTTGTLLPREPVARRFGIATAQLAAELGHLGTLGLPPGWSESQGLNAQQSETLRKMLLAVAADPRLIVARLAEALIRLRHVRELASAEQQRLALETQEIFAPLANRLGIWNLKWELEDLAFRQLDPDQYHHIAKSLARRRVDRERYIREVCTLLEQELEAAGVHAAVSGRPKHIYSIWRKMQRKQLPFEQLFDVRAVRIVCESIADCYAALGIVHGRWPYIPGEFDDYIATPKDNNYRSIHTAVTGPEGLSLEIQIRTRDMHESAELGVAAHWRYKEGGARNLSYERKIERARELLAPGQADDGDFLDRVRTELFADRIYALTPRGEIVDLPRGATPLDFAYHVHTELGPRCRGARVNGRIAPLDAPLANGEIVEIITGRIGGPSRDWLNPEQGFVVSPRSRAKVRAWFRAQEEAASQLVAEAPTPVVAPVATPPETLNISRRGGAKGPARSPVDIEGVGDLPTTMARCCAPVPPEPIAGYLTLGRGVTIHRASCASFKRMAHAKPDRALSVEWNLGSETLMPVQIRVEALDRRGLLRDVSDVMAVEHLSIEGVNSNTDPTDRVATIVMRTAVRDTEQLNRVCKRLLSVPNVLKAQRNF